MFLITAHGNVGHDPEQKPAGQTNLTTFSLAVTTGKDRHTGEKITEWINCEVWGARGDVVMQYIKRGSAITVQGSGQVDRYTSRKDASEKTGIKMKVDHFTLPPKDTAAPQAAAPARGRAPEPRRWQEEAEESLPF